MKTPKVLALNPDSCLSNGYFKIQLSINSEPEYCTIISSFRDIRHVSKESKKELKGCGSLRNACRKIKEQIRSGNYVKYKIYSEIDGVVLGRPESYTKTVRAFFREEGVPVFTMDYVNSGKVFLPLGLGLPRRIFPLVMVRSHTKRLHRGYSFINQKYVRELADAHKWNELAALLYEENTGLLLSQRAFSNVRLVDIFRAHNVTLYAPVRENNYVENVRQVWPYD